MFFKSWKLAYAGDGNDPSDGGVGLETPPPAPDTNGDGVTATNGDSATAAEKLLNQKQVDKIVEDRLNRERAKLNAEKQKIVDQLESVKKSKGTSDKEREDLASKIEELKNSMLTKEQLAEKEKQKLKQESESKLKEAEEKAKRNWELYEKSTIHRDIVDAAAKHEAFSPKQIVTHLKDITQLVEDKDPETSQGLGTYTPKVKFPDSKEGQPITLDLTVEQAVKRMKEMPDEFGNLFKSGVSGGLGGTSGAGGGGVSVNDEAPKDPQKYRLWREKQKKAGKL